MQGQAVLAGDHGGQGAEFAQPLDQRRHLLQREPAAAPAEDIENEHHETQAGQVVSEGPALIVVAPQGRYDRRRGFGAVGDLLLPVILEAVVAMRGEYAGPSRCRHRDANG